MLTDYEIWKSGVAFLVFWGPFPWYCFVAFMLCFCRALKILLNIKWLLNKQTKKNAQVLEGCGEKRTNANPLVPGLLSSPEGLLVSTNACLHTKIFNRVPFQSAFCSRSMEGSYKGKVLLGDSALDCKFSPGQVAWHLPWCNFCPFLLFRVLLALFFKYELFCLCSFVLFFFNFIVYC